MYYLCDVAFVCAEVAWLNGTNVKTPKYFET